MTGDPALSGAQLALNVADLDGSMTFYPKRFVVEPAKRNDTSCRYALQDKVWIRALGTEP